VHKTDRIYVGGHQGLLGSALVRRLRAAGFSNLLVANHRELELTDPASVYQFFAREQPQHVLLAAARVGGILANYSFPADFIFENLSIQTNVIHAAYRSGVDRLLFAGSSCIYPKEAPQPLREESLLTGPLEFTNRSYAVAKIAGIEMCWAYNRQHRTRYLGAMFTNLYGVGDNYHPTDSHLIPALIRKTHDARMNNEREVVVWGTGTPRREFLYADDAADACLFLLTLPGDQFAALTSGEDRPPLINVGWGSDMTIREVAEIVAEVIGFSGKLVFDATKPDGTLRKLLDTSYLNSLGWKPQTNFREGLRLSYHDFCSRVAEQHAALEVRR